MESNNTKAIREALCEIVLLTVKAGKSISCDVACGIIASKAKHALAAPPRNCDIYTDIDSAFRACQEDRGYLKSPIDERRSVISFMLSTNTSGEANKDEGEPDESK